MSNLNLKQNPTLRDFQNYVADLVKERGFDKETASEIFMLFFEECGEMAKAARKTQKMRTDKHSEQFHLSHEIADVFIYLLDICHFYALFKKKHEYLRSGFLVKTALFDHLRHVLLKIAKRRIRFKIKHIYDLLFFHNPSTTLTLLPLCPREESNLDRLVRSEQFCPLNYEG